MLNENIIVISDRECFMRVGKTITEFKNFCKDKHIDYRLHQLATNNGFVPFLIDNNFVVQIENFAQENNKRIIKTKPFLAVDTARNIKNLMHFFETEG